MQVNLMALANGWYATYVWVCKSVSLYDNVYVVCVCVQVVL